MKKVSRQRGSGKEIREKWLQGVYIVRFMIILRIILINLFSFLKNESMFYMFYFEINSPFFAFGEHVEGFLDVEFAGSKETELIISRCLRKICLVFSKRTRRF